MSKEPREIFEHIDRHEVNRNVAVMESDEVFSFFAGTEPVGSLTFRTPSRDEGVTPEAVIAAVEDHLKSFDPTRGETNLAVSQLEQSRKFLAAGRDFAKIAKRELGEGNPKPAKAKPPEAESKKAKSPSNKEK